MSPVSGIPSIPKWFRGSGGGTPQQAAQRPQGPTQRAAAAPPAALRGAGQGVAGGSHGKEEEAAEDPTLGLSWKCNVNPGLIDLEDV